MRLPAARSGSVELPPLTPLQQHQTQPVQQPVQQSSAEQPAAPPRVSARERQAMSGALVAAEQAQRRAAAAAGVVPPAAENAGVIFGSITHVDLSKQV